MKYYLLKTEPTVYSYSDLERDKKAVWDGVTSPGGLFQIKTARKGDVAFIYHTGGEKQVVGICEITTDPYVDPKAGNPKIFIFDRKMQGIVNYFNRYLHDRIDYHTNTMFKSIFNKRDQYHRFNALGRRFSLGLKTNSYIFPEPDLLQGDIIFQVEYLFL